MREHEVIDWDDIPTVTEEPAFGAYEPSGVHTALAANASRRTVLRSAVALGGTLGLTALGWLPPMRGRSASANVGTEHTNCSIYSYDGVICSPYPYSSSWCGADGWFKNYHDSTISMGPLKICNGRNAWRWKSGSSNYRCADGTVQPRGGSAQRKICSKKL